MADGAVIEADAYSGDAEVEEIVCPEGVVEVGNCAFRRCPKLRRVVLPEGVSDYSASWFRECPSLEEVVLPGAWECLNSAPFEIPNLKRLVIGVGTSAVKPGAFERSKLESVEVAAGNPHLWTDGTALYTADKKVLLACMRPVAEYAVAEGCEVIGEKAFYGRAELASVELPESVRELAPFAFARSGLRRFDAPPALRTIGDKAFLHCKQLTAVALPGGLESIGDEAFADSALEAIDVPASVSHLGRCVAARSAVRRSGEGSTFRIDAASPYYFTGAQGGLYRRADDGIHFEQLLDDGVAEYAVEPGTTHIDAQACAMNASIEHVVLPEGLVRIGDAAFRACGKLRQVEMPESVREIGKDAFIDTVLEEFHVPAALESLGERALVSVGAYHEGEPPSLRRITVDLSNPRFFTTCGMLCERIGEAGGSEDAVKVVMFTNSARKVVFPDEVTEVAPFAFNNAFGIEELCLNARLRTIGACGLSVWCWVRHIRIEVPEPIEGRSAFDLYFPDTSRAVHGFLMAIGMSSHISLPEVMRHYDNSIVTARDYRQPAGTDNIGAYEQVQMILGRLDDPVLLTDESRGRFMELVRGNIADICVDVARHDDRETIDKLIESGCLNEDNIDRVIEAVGALQDAAMTGHLLEAKRRRFGGAAVDFEL